MYLHILLETKRIRRKHENKLKRPRRNTPKASEHNREKVHLDQCYLPSPRNLQTNKQKTNYSKDEAERNIAHKGEELFKEGPTDWRRITQAEQNKQQQVTENTS